MSLLSENPKAVSRDLSQERKISFKGLEKCLEAFTSGEGRVVRKYARLLSQLSGRQQENEDGDISWSSSDEDNPGVSSQNITICRRSTLARKLNSQIDFETRIRSKEHGRRLTKAHFSRSVNRLFEDPLSLSSKDTGRTKATRTVNKARPALEESCPSILDKSFLVESSQISVVEPLNEKQAPNLDVGLSQDQLGVSADEKLEAKRTAGIVNLVSEESCPSILNASFLGETSQISFAEAPKDKKIPEVDLPLELTPHTENSTNCCDTISPVFKTKPKKTARRYKHKVRSGSRETIADCSESNDDLSAAHCKNFSGDINANEKFVTSPEAKKAGDSENAINAISYLGSPVLESRISRRSRTRNTCNVIVLPTSPVVRQSVRIRRQNGSTNREPPVSPVLEPKTKSFKKRRKIGHDLLRNTSPSRTLTEISAECNILTSPIIGQKLLSSEKIPRPRVLDRSKHLVKRSLQFDLKDDANCSLLEREDNHFDLSLGMNDTSVVPEKSALNELDLLQTILSSTEPEEVQKTCQTEPDTLNETTLETLAHKKPHLNETNVIEEVFTEELKFPKSPELVGRRKRNLSLQRNSIKRKSSGDDPVCQEIIEENSETQAFVIPRTPNKSIRQSHREPINLNETVFIDEDSETQNYCTRSVNKTTSKVSIGDGQDFASTKLHGTILIDEDSQSQCIPCSPSTPAKSESQKENQRDGQDESSTFEKQQMEPEGEAKSGQVLKSIQEASEVIRNEFRSASIPENRSIHSKLPSFVLKTTDQELIISQSSTRSGNNDRIHLNGGRTELPEIESVSSQASRENHQTDKPLENNSRSVSNKKSPAVSSPMVISSVGSSPDVRRVADLPFVVVEDEYNAPPKRRGKKLDPNGIAARLQRLLNQRRSAAHIWQFKRSKLNRLNDKDEAGTEEGTRGRVLSVRTVWVESSHVVISTTETQRELGTGKEFRSNVLVVLDPGVVFRIGKIMTASSIEIFPPWQAMDLAERNTTVVLGANIVEVLSTEPNLNKSLQSTEEPATVQKYTCQCVPPAPDAVVVDCWDGAQTIGLLDILFPRETPPCSQLLHCDSSIAQVLNSSNTNNAMFKQHKYSIQELLSTHGTISHGKGHLVLTILRVLCFWQRYEEPASRNHSLPCWSVLGEDDSKEVCEVILGPASSKDSERLQWSDFMTGRVLGRKCKFRGLAISQRSDRSRHCGTWTAFPEDQKIVYVLVPSSQFSLTIENSTAHRKAWEPDVTALAKLVNTASSANESAPTTPHRVSVICRVFHANERRFYVGDHSVSPQVCSVVLRPSVFVPPSISIAVKRPRPTKLLVLLQDVEVSKGVLTADKFSRVLPLNDEGYAYEEGSFRRNWPASQDVHRAISCAMAILPLFSYDSCVHSLVLLTGSVSGVEESSALIWPACGLCGSPVNTEETATSNALHFCAECSGVSEQMVVHMALVVLVSCPGIPRECSVRVKLLQNTIKVLLRAMPKEGQDFTVRDALGKPIGPIRCEVTSVHNGNFVLQELPTSLWK